MTDMFRMTEGEFTLIEWPKCYCRTKRKRTAITLGAATLSVALRTVILLSDSLRRLDSVRF